MRRILTVIGVTLAAAACSTGLAVNASLDHPQLWLLYVLGAAGSGVIAVTFPVLRSLLPLLLEEQLRPAAFALQSTYGSFGMMAGPAVGGVLMIAIERLRKRKAIQGLDGLEHVSPTRALVIGAGQCLSMWPGSSRSMCTIVAGQLCGLSTRTAAEFSFLLALPTLGAATCYDFYKSRDVLFGSGINPSALAIGLGVSFLVAWAVIAAFLRYLQRRGLEPFGYYRILLAIAVFWCMH